MGAHLAHKVLIPANKIDKDLALFDIPLRAYPGKPIVITVPRETSRDLGGVDLSIPIEVADKYLPDLAVVADPANCEGLERGMLVAVKPYTGVWFDHRGFDWIPEGRWLKILGTAESWTENVLCEVEIEEDQAA